MADCLDRQEELKKRLAINSLRNTIKINLPSFTLKTIYENSEADFLFYEEKIKVFQKLWKADELGEELSRVGTNDEHYYEWILTEIPCIGDCDIWLVTSRDSYGYWAEIKGSNRLDSIKELWHKDKKTGGQILGYSKGFFAINKSINMIIDVGSRLGVYDRGYNPEYYYTLSTLKI